LYARLAAFAEGLVSKRAVVGSLVVAYNKEHRSCAQQAGEGALQIEEAE